MTNMTHPSPLIGDRFNTVARLHGVFDDGSPEWHEARLEGVGGSDIAKLCGWDRTGPYRLMMEKRGMFKEVISPELQELFDTGHDVEPVIANRMSKVLGSGFDMVTNAGSWSSVDRPWALANPDAFIIDKATGETHIGEFKFTRNFKYTFEGGFPPSKYVAQVRHYMGVFGISSGWLGAFAGDEGRHHHWVIPADPAKPVVDIRTGAEEFYPWVNLEHMNERGEWFMGLWERNEFPDPDPDPALTEWFMSTKTDTVLEGEHFVSDDLAWQVRMGRVLSAAGENMLETAKLTLARDMGHAKTAVHRTVDGKPKTVASVVTGRYKPYLKWAGRVDAELGERLSVALTALQ